MSLLAIMNMYMTVYIPLPFSEDQQLIHVNWKEDDRLFSSGLPNIQDVLQH